MANLPGPQSASEKKMEDNLRPATCTSERSQTTDLEAMSASRFEKYSQDPDLVGWEGPDDPENPFNWKTYKKARQLVFMAFNTFLTYVTHLLFPNKAIPTPTSQTIGVFNARARRSGCDEEIWFL